MDAIIASYITAFLLGLFSAAHCVGMCGSIIGVLTMNLPNDVRESPRRMLPYVFNYNLGRIVSYGIAGLFVGLLSTPLAKIEAFFLLRLLSVIVMIGMGLHLAGWWPTFARVERLGAPIWRKLQPLGQRLIPVRSRLAAFFLGLVWGWLPCGLVYAALLVAATAGDAVKAAGVMLAFGTGTLPAVMGTGLFAGMLSTLSRTKHLRQAAGLLIIALALISLMFPFGSGAHDAHEHGSHQHHHVERPNP